VSRVQFIPPALATLRTKPPTGEQWQYEVKFDGFRIQIHKLGLAVALFGKNRGNLTTRFPTIAWRSSLCQCGPASSTAS
jgi:bifunctional non-homologous end joining protein LigD